jgi:hypothetical protein
MLGPYCQVLGLARVGTVLSLLIPLGLLALFLFFGCFVKLVAGQSVSLGSRGRTV